MTDGTWKNPFRKWNSTCIYSPRDQKWYATRSMELILRTSNRKYIGKRIRWGTAPYSQPICYCLLITLYPHCRTSTYAISKRVVTISKGKRRKKIRPLQEGKHLKVLLPEQRKRISTVHGSLRNQCPTSLSGMQTNKVKYKMKRKKRKKKKKGSSKL